ncbi:hypothetical protein T492DRAFT_975486 [Pavlovales sp. CCMP2436]|nr:hypothetical protein T492DRAFT_975486 [Pavlovales sp. CCMP2436]
MSLLTLSPPPPHSMCRCRPRPSRPCSTFTTAVNVINVTDRAGEYRMQHNALGKVCRTPMLLIALVSSAASTAPVLLGTAGNFAIITKTASAAVPVRAPQLGRRLRLLEARMAAETEPGDKAGAAGTRAKVARTLYMHPEDQPYREGTRPASAWALGAANFRKQSLTIFEQARPSMCFVPVSCVPGGCYTSHPASIRQDASTDGRWLAMIYPPHTTLPLLYT